MKHNRNNDAGMGFVLFVLIGIFAMPLVGLSFLFGKDPDKKALGIGLTVIGFLLWLVAFG